MTAMKLLMVLFVISVSVAPVAYMVHGANTLGASEAAQIVWQADGLSKDEHGVAVTIGLKIVDQAQAELVIELEAHAKGLTAYHLYGLRSKGGIPTALRLGSGLVERGPLRAESPSHLDKNGLEVFKPGKVLLVQPIWLPSDNQSVEIYLSYMSCSASDCRFPVLDKVISFKVQGVSDERRPLIDRSIKPIPAATAVSQAQEYNAAEHKRNADATGISWVHATSIEAIEKLIADEHKKGNHVLLDFTGPSCTNCQAMAKNVFILPQVAA
ncbi:MAG: hypothetical protein HRU15_06120, partial [Planctomycetes bacterium]|nr:hypothetical protein [Planctomycetota bacterium]